MTTGIVCEYNPFHNGHLYQIKKAKAMGADKIVCVMSGNFVQRGDIAVCEKQFFLQVIIKKERQMDLENVISKLA